LTGKADERKGGPPALGPIFHFFLCPFDALKCNKCERANTQKTKVKTKTKKRRRRRRRMLAH
jgi:hypothetical protein